MGSAAASWLLLMAAEVSDLTLAYGESARPRVCVPSGAATSEATPRARGSSPWDRVHQQPFEALCIGLARAQVRLSREPARALAAARELVLAWPGRAEPRVLEARALLGVGDATASFAAWQRARELGGELDADRVSAHALRDYAAAAALSGHPELAAEVYRRLVSLLDAWPDPREVQRLYLEAASAALRRSPPQFDEAEGYLAAAERGARSTGLRAYAAGLRALLLARRGGSSSDPSWLDAPEVWHLVRLTRGAAVPRFWPRVPRHELHAIASMLVEPYSSVDAAESWDRYVQGLSAGPTDPALSSFARARQARLARAGAMP